MCAPLRATVLAAALAVTTVAGTVRADDAGGDAAAAEARRQYQDGTKAYSAKRYSEAAQHFEAAAAFKANAVALYTAGVAWDLASKPERAADAYARALEVPGLEPKHASMAQGRVAALEKSLGTVMITSSEPGWKVQLDALTETTTPARLHGAAGPHVLTILIPNKPAEHRDVLLEPGKTTTIELKDEPEIQPERSEPEVVKERPATPPPPREVPVPVQRASFWTPIKVLGVGVAGVGVAALGAAAILGSSATGAKDAYEAARSQAGYDHASSLETWTNVALLSGLVLVAGGVALVVIPTSDRPESSVKIGATPGGLTVRGGF